MSDDRTLGGPSGPCPECGIDHGSMICTLHGIEENSDRVEHIEFDGVDKDIPEDLEILNYPDSPEPQIDYGKCIRSVKEVTDGTWCHYHGIVLNIFIGPMIKFIDADGDFYTNIGTQDLPWLIDCGFVFTARAGAERDLRAVQTIAEVARMADWVDGGLGDYWTIEQDWDSSAFIAIRCLQNRYFISDRPRFYQRDSCFAAIDSIGQARLTEVYEAGRSL